MVGEENTELSLKLRCGEETDSIINPYSRRGSPFSCRILCEAAMTEYHNGRDMVSTPLGGNLEFKTFPGNFIAASCALAKRKMPDMDAVSCRGGRKKSDNTNRLCTPRKNLRLTKYQSSILEECFKEHPMPSRKHKYALANKLNLQPRQVEVWFQNQRARTKLRQTEVECENLKRCCQNLEEENRKLEREVQAQKAMKIVQGAGEEDLYAQSPNSMPLVAATFKMCTSCERLATKTTVKQSLLA